MPNEARTLDVRVTPDPVQLMRSLDRANRRSFDHEVTPRLEAVSKNAAVALRNAIRQIPNTSGETTNLRARMAAATGTKTEIRGGMLAQRQSTVAVLIDANKMPPGQRTLPRHMERAKGWRHPVYGNREKWVRQPGHPYFYSTLDAFRPFWSAAVKAAMDATMREAART